MKEKSAFITIIGRPNVGKSSLMNRILGTKVAIVSDKPQTMKRAALKKPLCVKRKNACSTLSVLQ